MPALSDTLRRTSFALIGALALPALTACMPASERPVLEYDMPEEAPYGDRDDPPILTVEVEPLDIDMLYNKPGRRLPRTPVGPLNVTELPLSTVLDVLLTDVGVAYTIDSAAAARTVTINHPGRRPLNEMIEFLSRHTGVFYTYSDGVLQVESERDFILTLPRQGDSLNNISGTMAQLGANDVDASEDSGLVSFTADRRGALRVADYIHNFWTTRDMIVFDVHVLEVSLTDDRDIGINWRELSANNIFGSDINIGSAFTSSGLAEGGFEGITISPNGSSGILTMDVVMGFLQSQGEVTSLAKPTVSITNGGEAELTVGETQEYINEVTTSRDEDDDDVDIDVSTDEVETAITVTMAGTFSNGLVYTDVELDIQELLRFEEFSTGESEESTSLNLPVQTERLLTTTAHLRPGDTLVIGGIIQENDENQRDELAFFNAPIRKGDFQERLELVMLLSPRVVQYRPRKRFADWK
ncbi:MAG: hypothetical protein Alpg2KO_24030 [Alphaproteobacteria bacterium]